MTIDMLNFKPRNIVFEQQKKFKEKGKSASNEFPDQFINDVKYKRH